ncbi:MAG: hypothetical protein CEE43_15400 [Promethearchaeota archaeon Loki_b32]|nr:MAG: hypothetical protein CEE43_15400 [Candidatus Lokiarchaeota archaeon Loki_b32]
MKTNTKKIIVLIILGIGFVFLPNIKLNFSVDQKTNLSILKESGGYSEPFIHIDGSIPGNWSDTVSDYPWCDGSGTWNDPYIIENVTINAINSPTGSGIYINNSMNDYFTIRNCTVYNAGWGEYNANIKLENTCNGTLIDNTCSTSARNGIFLFTNCKNNTISGNTANGNSYGIRLYNYCDYNTVSGNSANNNSDHGIYLYDCDYNTVSGNTACNNTHEGIFLVFCNNNTISGNTANGNIVGICIYYDCDYNTITGNTANGNGFGIFIYYSDYNNITGNTAKDNDNAGIQFELHCDYNTITENFFVKNAKHAIDFDGVIKIDNKWNSTTIGNYWDNHTGPDANSDGIVDNPYTFIDGPSDMVDYLPIAEDGAPRITIVSPSEGQRFGRDAPTFEIEVVDIYVWEMWYTIDGGLHNYTFTENEMINQSAWDALLDGSVIIRFYAIDIVGNVAFEEVSVLKNVPSGLDPGVITTIVIVSIVGGVAVIAGVYIFMKKRATQE